MRNVLTLPGTHLIGYLCDNVPQFPREPVSRRVRKSVKMPSSSWKHETDRLDLLSKSSNLDNWILSKKKKLVEKEGFNEHIDSRGLLNSGREEEKPSSVAMTIIPTSVSEIHMYANASSLLHPQPGSQGRGQRTNQEVKGGDKERDKGLFQSHIQSHTIFSRNFYIRCVYV